MNLVSTQTILHTPTYKRNDARGEFLEITNNGTWKTVIHATMNAGAVLGNHYHKQTRIYVFVVEGRVLLQQVDIHTGERWESRLGSEVGAVLEVDVAHRMLFLEKTVLLLLKSRPHEDADAVSFDVERNFSTKPVAAMASGSD